MATGQKQDKIAKIIDMRVRGKPITQIANELGVTRQYVYSVFRYLPKGACSYSINRSLNHRTKCRILRDYINLMPSEGELQKHSLEFYQEQALQALVCKYGLAESVILEFLYSISGRHSRIAASPYYTAIDCWRTSHAISLPALAKMACCSVPYMQRILRGWNHMPLFVAIKIKDNSGLLITEIYGDLLALDRKRSSSHG